MGSCCLMANSTHSFMSSVNMPSFQSLTICLITKASLLALAERMSLSPGSVSPNNSFKSNLLRSGNGVAKKAFHAVTSSTQVGLIQAFGPIRLLP